MKNLAKIWDELTVATGGCNQFGTTKELHADIMRQLSNIAKHNKSILDMGCGRGGHALFLAKHGCHVAGVDFSRVALDAARKTTNSKKNKVSFIKADIAKKLPFPDKSFDAVICMGNTFGVLPTASLCKRCLGEVRRLARRDVLFELRTGFEKRTAKYTKNGKTIKYPVKVWTPKEAETLFKKTGFKNVRVSLGRKTRQWEKPKEKIQWIFITAKP